MTLVEQIILGGALILAVTAAATFSFRVYRIARRIDDALGVDREGRTISDRLSRVEHQLFPNGGSSLTDKINRIEFEQRHMQTDIASLKAVMDAYVKGTK